MGCSNTCYYDYYNNYTCDNYCGNSTYITSIFMAVLLFVVFTLTLFPVIFMSRGCCSNQYRYQGGFENYLYITRCPWHTFHVLTTGFIENGVDSKRIHYFNSYFPEPLCNQSLWGIQSNKKCRFPFLSTIYYIGKSTPINPN